MRDKFVYPILNDLRKELADSDAFWQRCLDMGAKNIASQAVLKELSKREPLIYLNKKWFFSSCNLQTMNFVENIIQEMGIQTYCDSHSHIVIGNISIPIPELSYPTRIEVRANVHIVEECIKGHWYATPRLMFRIAKILCLPMDYFARGLTNTTMIFRRNYKTGLERAVNRMTRRTVGANVKADLRLIYLELGAELLLHPEFLPGAGGRIIADILGDFDPDIRCLIEQKFHLM